MAFRRTMMPPPGPVASELTSRMAGIGMNFAAEPDTAANIEDTLVYASEVGVSDGDLRVLSILTTWFGQHHGHVNADRLVRVVQEHPNARVRAYWTALAQWLEKDRRFARLESAYEGERLDLLPVGTSFQVARRGEDPRFEGGPLRVPAGTLRDREADVLGPEALTRLHRGYRNRVLMGPSWRADVWTILERDPELSVAEAARRAYCGFATAWAVVQDFQVLSGAQNEIQVA